MAYELRSARWLAADCQRAVILPGDRVIDATMGNGHDTLFLARLVGDTGHVTAFDLQPDAVKSTAARLAENGVADRCELHCLGHEHMAEIVTEPVRAVVFNLGWLPGGDKSVTTRWETTKRAVEAAMGLLLPGGVITICVYPGHEAGDIERRSLTEWLAQVRPQAFNILHQRFLNAGPGAPECVILQKMG